MMKAQLFDHLGNTLGTLVVIVDPSGLNESIIERLWNHWLWELSKISLDQVRNNMWLINTKVNIKHIWKEKILYEYVFFRSKVSM